MKKKLTKEELEMVNKINEYFQECSKYPLTTRINHILNDRNVIISAWLGAYEQKLGKFSTKQLCHFAMNNYICLN